MHSTGQDTQEDTGGDGGEGREGCEGDARQETVDGPGESGAPGEPGAPAEPVVPAGPAGPAESSGPAEAAQAFDLLYVRHARALTRQAYVLCGNDRLAQRAVAHGFHHAWERWPEVAVDADPGGWVRAATYAYALAPWRRTRRSPRGAPAEDRPLLTALLRLPRSYRAALLLRDGLGLGLAATAAETEASTPATAGRLRHARAALAAHLPESAADPTGRRNAELVARLRALAEPRPVRVTPAPFLRRASERVTRQWTGAALAVTLAFAAVTTAVALPSSLAPHHAARPEVVHDGDGPAPSAGEGTGP